MMAETVRGSRSSTMICRSGPSSACPVSASQMFASGTCTAPNAIEAAAAATSAAAAATTTERAGRPTQFFRNLRRTSRIVAATPG